MRLLKFLLIFFGFLFLTVSYVRGKDINTEYYVNYYLDEKNPQWSKVIFNIKINYFRSNIVVDKYQLSFPDYFQIDNLKTSLDGKNIENSLLSKDDQIIITLQLPNRYLSRMESEQITIEFFQKNLFQKNGNVYELMLPTLFHNDQNNLYQITVYNNLLSSKNKITIAKPLPDLITGNQIIWKNPKTKTIYAVFGEYQIYKADFNYYLKNEKIRPILTEIALPPDTLYQKVYLNNLNPLPSKIYQDDDGNYLAQYLLKPKEEKLVNFQGYIQVFSSPRQEVINYDRKKLESQKKYLLTSKKHWRIDNLTENISTVTTIGDIYQFVINNLSYDYQNVSKPLSRKGGQKALEEKKGVCTEFSDLFISLAREKGFFSREIQGYGYTNNSKLRPIALNMDVLHSWPEYYDLKSEAWRPLDPTWEKTSGIDYFTSFDLSHIAFVIHGFDSEYPIPAGAYKSEKNQGKNLIIEVTTELPKENKKIEFNIDQVNNQLNSKQSSRWVVEITNFSNTYLYNESFYLMSLANKLTFEPKKIIIDRLAPLEKIAYTIEVTPKNVNRKTEDYLIITNQKGFEKKRKIILYPFYFKFLTWLLIFNSLLLFFVIILYVKRRSRKKSSS